MKKRKLDEIESSRTEKMRTDKCEIRLRRK